MRISLVAVLLGSAWSDFAPRRVTVDLAVDPEHRWDSIVAEHKDNFVQAITQVLSSPQVKPIAPLAKKLLGNALEARRLLPGSIYLEAKGIARELGLDVADLVLVGAFYDMATSKHHGHKACTGIVAQAESGEIIHGRNLDYAFGNALANVTLVVDFVRAGSVLFTAVTFGPNPTFDTVVRWGSFSLTQNERDTGSIANNLWDMLVLGRPALFARIRQAAEELSSFEEALTFFSTVRLNAAAYFIIGGTKAGEGAVVTSGRASAESIRRIDASTGRWYVLETNYDHEVAPPKGDNRRGPAERAMNATGSAGITPETMWDVISLTKVNRSAGERAPLNGHTIYSTVMQAANTSTFKTMVRSHRHTPSEIGIPTPSVIV